MSLIDRVPEVEFYQEERAAAEGESDTVWRWRVKAANGEKVIPPEGHSSERDAIRAFLRAADIMWEAKEHFITGE